ncbi:MAG: 1-(5-phosphoribosyl)-5-[(5-phosphoribosylamino)methylideneamino]imidazole-4-carboxamide isomerase [Dehalococcoidia bacterium]|nr:1-(5-phosphoribosyl)-5-[(5-phosphoribosylamino)methylideneamino]imidazole-4-carboxamide isomerase [Dehalococcoidia bacterium]
MEVIPAIDLRGGKCVRLYQGDYAREQVFSDDPVSVAMRWQQEGAPRLHVVDLDGAAEGSPGNLAVIGRIAKSAAIPVQVGGGIRTLATARRLLKLGVDRVVLGTVAVEKPALVRQAVERLGADRIVVALDARDGKVAIKGWREQSSVDALDLLRQMQAAGVRVFIYTDIARDGTMTEPNFTAIARMARQAPGQVIASGGISREEHLVRLARLGVAGAIVGKALYTGGIMLPSALAAVSATRRTAKR